MVVQLTCEEMRSSISILLLEVRLILNCDGAVESLRISRSELPMDAAHFDHDVPGLYRDRHGYVWSTIHLVSRVEGFAAGMFKLGFTFSR